jgi:hypothetical protein
MNELLGDVVRICGKNVKISVKIQRTSVDENDEKNITEY